MSKADEINKELEEAIKQYITHAQYFINQEDRDAIETIIEVAENSISKEVIEDKKEENRENKRYYDEENIIHDEEYYRIEGKIEILEELLEQK